MTKGYIHSLESFGSVDGPGVRYLIFTTGCAMRCQFCHNPDTWNMNSGTLYTADELINKAWKYRTYWGSKGGITVSGGEPLLQIDFLLELFQKAKERGINTTLDTCGNPFTRGALFYVALRVWQSLSRAEPIDVFPLCGNKPDKLISSLKRVIVVHLQHFRIHNQWSHNFIKLFVCSVQLYRLYHNNVFILLLFHTQLSPLSLHLFHLDELYQEKVRAFHPLQYVNLLPITYSF